MSHIYVYCQDLGLSPAQRTTIVVQLQKMGKSNGSPMPHLRNHWRVNLAGDAVIFESDWDMATITAAAIKTRLVSLFNVAANTITYATVTPTFATRPSEVATYKYSTVNKFRIGVFGGRDASYGESLAEVQAYLKANAAAWEAPA